MFTLLHVGLYVQTNSSTNQIKTIFDYIRQSYIIAYQVQGYEASWQPRAGGSTVEERVRSIFFNSQIFIKNLKFNNVTKHT